MKESVKAHTGAVICVRWNSDGTALATAGEDGVIKQWSAGGRLRSRLAQVDGAVHTVVWGMGNQAICYCTGRKCFFSPVLVLRTTLRNVLNTI